MPGVPRNGVSPQVTFRSPLQTFKWFLAVLVTLVITSIMYYDSALLQQKECLNDQDLGVIAERWIVVDGTNLSNDEVLHIDDVPGWRILVFGGHIGHYKGRRCTNCIFIRNIMTRRPSSATNIKMSSYVHAISHGAKWIYVTNHIANLNKQVERFHFNETMTGLLYKGETVFDSDHYFGTTDVSGDRTSRLKSSLYQLGGYLTPSIQSNWKPPRHIWEAHNAGNINVCRLPPAIVRERLVQPTNLVGSLIGYKSFWVLGSLVTERKSPSLACWWSQLMKHTQVENIVIYPPSCSSVPSFRDTGDLCPQQTQVIVNKFQCRIEHSFFTCGILLSEAMLKHELLREADVVLLKSWFDTLATLQSKQPDRENTGIKTNPGSVHTVILQGVFTSTSLRKTLENPFKGICNLTNQIRNPTTLTPINDILLIVIFNTPNYYSNVLYLDYIYRKYFTNILYCGSEIDSFHSATKAYPGPLNFLEVSEVGKGYFGYVCAAYAMDMGFHVKGYLQAGDDVMLNMWNIGGLPTDRMWFQHDIRNDAIEADNVPNIAKFTKWSFWIPWVSKHGIVAWRKILASLEALKKTAEESRVVSFLQQLHTNSGGKTGAFYGASDIFYVPDRYKHNFNFFAKISIKFKLHLELAIPSMLCGFDDINNIVRLKGTYLWFKERSGYANVYNPEHVFLHPWKLKQLLTQLPARDFFCSKYFSHIEGKTL